MEVDKIPKLANEFWPSFFKRKLILVILSQISLVLTLGVVLVLNNIVSLDSKLFWIIIISFFAFSLIINILIFILSTKPTKDLMAAVLQVSGEKTNLKPPNPNTEKNKKTGFYNALQTIYELSSKTGSGDTSQNTDNSSITDTAINSTQCGIVVLNEKREIIYSNKSAPVHIDRFGKKNLDLIFVGIDNLDQWLDDCLEQSVHAENLWTRVPDKLPNQEGRRFFDVIASYNRGSIAETTLLLVDRTTEYSVDEENLDFIAFAAHELRGPITVIRGYIDVLNDELSGVLKDDQQELFHRLIVSSNRLSGYIDNILNTSRYDRRHLTVHLLEDSIKNVFDMINDDMQLRASSQNRLLSINIPPDLPTVAIDKTSISEVFGNLIDNAIKYSNEGGVINVTAKANMDFVEVSVEDKGIGMPISVVGNLFQKFYRSHRSRETVAGTGIGLYISKAIVESHGGTIRVASEDGLGSTFTVSLPIYSTVADKLKEGNNTNEGLISEGNGWIKNHSMYRG